MADPYCHSFSLRAMRTVARALRLCSGHQVHLHRGGADDQFRYAGQRVDHRHDGGDADGYRHGRRHEGHGLSAPSRASYLEATGLFFDLGQYRITVQKSWWAHLSDFFATPPAQWIGFAGVVLLGNGLFRLFGSRRSRAAGFRR